MSRKIIPPAEIDEDFLRDLVGNVSPVLRNPAAAADVPPVPPPVPVTESVAPPGLHGEPSVETPLKRRRILLPDYADTFLKEATVKRRTTVSINEQTRDVLINVLQHIGPYHLTLGGYIENILRNHIETYRDEINALHRGQRERNLL